MAEDYLEAAGSRSGDSCPTDPEVLSGEACVRCGFKCIQGCV